MIDIDGNKKAQYQLRRQGFPASKPNVLDIMKLRKEVTRFGRHSGNDFYLDSAKLDCFISRWHSEIHRVLQNGKIHFIITDNSLNGTYVNNHRVLGSHLLKVGEAVCFGHTNGKNLKPGDYAPQTDSEFEFVFEECTADGDEELEQAVVEQRSRVDHGLVDSTTDIHSSPTIPPLQSMATLPHGDSPLPGSNDASDRLASPKPSVTDKDVLQDISNKKSDPGLVPLDQFTGTNSNITVQVAQDRVFPESPTTITTLQPVNALIQDGAITSEETGVAQVSSSAADPVETRRPSHGSNQSHKSPTNKKATTRKRKSSTDSNGRKKKSKRGSLKKRPSHYDDEDEDSEDGDWHYDGDKCDSFNCKRPKSRKVNWVQCDDCDDWYHTTCVSVDYAAIRDDEAEFHCGCTG